VTRGQRWYARLTDDQKRLHQDRTTNRRTARRRFSLEGKACEICGIAATDRHHKNADTSDNSAENIAFLCRRCHMEEDGRLEALRLSNVVRAAGRTVEPRPCAHCRALSRELTCGRCHPCYVYFNRKGVDRLLPEEIEALNPPTCQRCGRSVNACKTKGYGGYCYSCRVHYRRRGQRPPELVIPGISSERAKYDRRVEI
jgi:hypothetical protein